MTDVREAMWTGVSVGLAVGIMIGALLLKLVGVDRPNHVDELRCEPGEAIVWTGDAWRCMTPDR